MSEQDDDIDDEIVAKVSDYLDGLLAGAERDDVANKIETDATWKQTHDEMVENRKFMSGMQKARAPESFTNEVTSTIHKRSAGRFFGRKTLGDRVPFNALLIVAIIALAAVGYLMWSSQTGSLKVENKPPATQPAPPPVKLQDVEPTPPPGKPQDVQPAPPGEPD
jgi:anti-sigma factor RsiW